MDPAEGEGCEGKGQKKRSMIGYILFVIGYLKIVSRLYTCSYEIGSHLFDVLF